MIRKIKRKHGANVVEYMALLVVVLGMIVFFRWFILRKFWGQWKKVGDGFSYGRQYDPRAFGNAGSSGGTLVCFREEINGSWYWISQKCFDEKCLNYCMLDPSDTAAGHCNSCMIDECSDKKKGAGAPYYAGLCGAKVAGEQQY